MPVKIESVNTLKKYFEGVTYRANCHAPNVHHIIYTLLGIVVLKKDNGTHIEVYGTDNNKTGNMLWVHIGGIRYSFRYEHSNDTIEIHKDTYKGELLLVINNSTMLHDILQIFNEA